MAVKRGDERNEYCGTANPIVQLTRPTGKVRDIYDLGERLLLGDHRPHQCV